MRDVVVVGCGAVGLPLAVALASRGARVLGVDIDPDRVRSLSDGDPGLLDEGLAPALAGALAGGHLRFAQAADCGRTRRAWALCVPTPVGSDLRLDATPIEAAFGLALASAAKGDLVMVRSTVPVGFTRGLAARAAGRDLAFAACPDRSLAGQGFRDQFETPHIVGGLDAVATAAARGVLQRLGHVECVSSPEAAEAVKLFANVWRDARFALANQLALYSQAAGLDFEELRAAGAAGFARFDIPRAGPVGGPCLTKDVHLLAQSAAEVGADVGLFLAARALNAGLAERVVGAILAEHGAARWPPRAAVLGLGFKGSPATLDQRGAIGVEVAARLRAALPGADVRTWDPAADPPQGAAAALAGADIVVLANDHPALAAADRLDGCAPGAVIYDLCGVLAGAPRPDLQVRRLGSGARRPPAAPDRVVREA